MTDEFLIKFAISTIVAIAFACQHVSQILVRMIKKQGEKDFNALLVMGTAILQLFSIGVIIEVIRYALSK